MINKQFVLPVLSYISLVLVLVSFKTTNATSSGHQNGEGSGNYECIDKERDALLHFKAYIHKDPFGSLSTWTFEEEATDCCKWNGVTCNNKTGHVTSLDLHLGNLEGKLSPALTNLSYLNYLDLSVNSFTGSIPMSIGSMTELRHLRLFDNSFTGRIPKSIGSLTQLMDLRLSYNSFYGTLPPELGNLTYLKALSLKYAGSCMIGNLDWLAHLSQLEELTMDGISLARENNWVNVIIGLRKLSYLSLCACDLLQVIHPYSYSSINSSSSTIVSLYLTKNNLNSSMYHWLSPLTSNKMVYLDLSHNKLSNIPRFLGNLCSLTFLNIYNNSMSFKFPDYLSNLSGCTSGRLKDLIVSNNQLTGSMSDDIQKFSSLEALYLSNNQLNGTLSEKMWQLPIQVLDISSNFLKGVISENIGKAKIFSINISNNSLEGVPSEAHMSNHSSIERIDLSSCKLGPGFPKWIQTLKNLTHIGIANTKISDTIPEEFWNTWPFRLICLNLSSNNITGKVTNLLSNFDPEISILDLSSNNFYGPITDVPSSLERLDLSRNNFFGEISFLCQISGNFFYFLDLSHNSFMGHIPDCLWHFKELTVLSLGHNNLSGKLPASIEYLINLEVLYLYKNNFSGNLPLSLKNCTKLTFLELGFNKFSGYVPNWIGENLLGLYALSLTSNNFFGTIPSQLCQLVKLQILDLSMNNLCGSIPSCLNNLTAMVQDGFSPYQNVHFYSCLTKICERKGGFSSLGNYVDHAIIKWQGSVREFSINLILLKSIDLSSNNLTGEIPYELTCLHGLIALNLSNNFIHGEIPHNISEMKNLLTLDLSKNSLSGGLPSSMSQMDLLNYLDMSHNNLSGRIPSSTQLQSFQPSRYNGNPGLCGLPLSKICPGDEEIIEVPQFIGESEDDGEDKDDLERLFYIGGATGFAIGFWTTCATLLVNHRGRNAFFHFIDILEDWVYVKVMVFIAKLQTVVHP